MFYNLICVSRTGAGISDTDALCASHPWGSPSVNPHNSSRRDTFFSLSRKRTDFITVGDFIGKADFIRSGTERISFFPAPPQSRQRLWEGTGGYGGWRGTRREGWESPIIRPAGTPFSPVRVSGRISSPQVISSAKPISSVPERSGFHFFRAPSISLEIDGRGQGGMGGSRRSRA